LPAGKTSFVPKCTDQHHSPSPNPLILRRSRRNSCRSSLWGRCRDLCSSGAVGRRPARTQGLLTPSVPSAARLEEGGSREAESSAPLAKKSCGIPCPLIQRRGRRISRPQTTFRVCPEATFRGSDEGCRTARTEGSLTRRAPSAAPTGMRGSGVSATERCRTRNTGHTTQDDGGNGRFAHAKRS